MSINYAAPEFLEELDQKADEMREKIRSTSTDVVYTGRAYYVAADGNDSADGSENAPWATLERVSAANLCEGDAVFFKRGDIFRGQLTAKRGVTYSAYGDGEKPKLYGSPFDMADPKKWIKTDVCNVYRYDAVLSDDIGAMIFNDGESCGIKVVKLKGGENGHCFNLETGEPFDSWRDLRHDLNFWHAYRPDEEKALYLYSESGNPGTRFKSIEFSPKGNLICAANGVTIDNLCLKYCGSHGIGCPTTENLKIRNCEFGWIGGSIQGEALFGRMNPTRFGNAVEIYGGCKNYTVTGCLFYQIYDAAITHQMNAGGKLYNMENVIYANNLIETSTYSIEYFLSSVENSGSKMSNILIENNFCRFSGFGWGNQRPDKHTPAHIKGWLHENPARNYVIRNNIFDRSRYSILQAGCIDKESEAVLQNNTYIQYEDGLLGDFGKMPSTTYKFNKNAENIIKNIFGDSEAKVYLVKDRPQD